MGPEWALFALCILMTIVPASALLAEKDWWGFLLMILTGCGIWAVLKYFIL